MIGSNISHYNVTDELGRGGMGVVYKADDTRLKRTVAIKVLPRHGLGDGGELSRFGREAQASAALNHPHIATVYEIDEEDGQSFIVMEYVDGPSLKDRIEVGPLKLEDVIELAIQIGSGLEAAHEQGITHRDIKPANVMLTGKGEAKIMDFGLAKLSGQTTLTQTGTTLGTVAYMSPEQARGEKVDHRSDIFALGVVIYEMLTGQSPYQGAYSEAIVYSILNVDPEPITALRTGVPMEFERIVDKALTKNQKERYQGLSDLLVDLRALQTKLPTLTAGSGSGVRAQSQRLPARWLRTLPWVVTGVLAVVSIVAFWQPWSNNGFGGALESQVTRFTIQLPPDAALPWRGHVLDISRDGTRLVFVAEQDSVRQLYLRPLEGFDSILMDGTEGALSPFFSPDGEWVGFFADGMLKKVSVQGGSPLELGRVAAAETGSWGTDGAIVYKETGHPGFYRISENGGEKDSLRIEGGTYHFNPRLLPGEKTLLMTSFVETDTGVSVLSLDTGEWFESIHLAKGARYALPGYLLYVVSDGLFADRFDVDRMDVTGDPQRIVDGVWVNEIREDHSQFTVSQNGVLAYIPGTADSQSSRLVWVDRAGDTEQLPFATISRPSGLRISPDGTRFVVTDGGVVSIGDFRRGDLISITPEDLQTAVPVWSPDGDHIVVASNQRGGKMNLVRISSDGSGELEYLPGSDDHQQPHSWLDNGETIVYSENAGDVWTVRTDGSEPATRILDSDANERHPAFSPDGHWIAYVSDKSGQDEVYVQPYPGPGKVEPVSSGGGVAPVWSARGDEIFYRDEGGTQVWMVTFDADPSIEPGIPEPLFSGEFTPPTLWTRQYDYSPETDRFLMMEKVPLSRHTQINVVLNWASELESSSQR